MAGNNVVVKTVNKVVYESDKNSYSRTIKQIRSIKKEWEKAGTAQRGAGGARSGYDKAAKQMQMVNKRLAETRAKEEAKASAHRVALARKEARAKEAIQKQSSARIRQTMNQMTGRNHDLNQMRKFYQRMEREAKRGNKGGAAGWGRQGPFNIRDIDTSRWSVRGQTGGTGMVGTPKPYSPAEIARQNRQMYNPKAQRQEAAKAAAAASRQAAADKLRQQRREAAREARASDVIGQSRTRLSSTYGRDYQRRLGSGASGRGIQELNREFKAGTISAGQYRQSIAALERQFRSSQNAGAGLAGTLSSIRQGMVGITAAYGAFNTGASILKQGQFFQGLDATMLMVSDDSDEAASRIKFVTDQSYRLGLSLKEASQGYVQMSIAADGIISKQQNNDLFKGYSEYATALQVDPVKYQRGITALQQMMGKGQIMAEELKQQLAEGIPGSMQVFLKATREAFGNSSLEIKDMMDMMQKGELKAQKVMPFVAKYYAEAANKGGALTKALQGNRVAMQRLGQTWVKFQNKIFESKFGETMTKVFNDLAKVLDNNGELASNIGLFFGSIIEGAMDIAAAIYNSFTLISRLLDYYAQEWGYQGSVMKEIFDWGGYVLGVTLFIGALSKVLKILTAIAGLRGALGAVRAAVSLPTATAAAAGARGPMGPPVPTAGSAGGPMGPPRPAGPTPSPSAPWSSLSKLGKFLKVAGPVGTLWSGYTQGKDQFGYDNQMARVEAYQKYAKDNNFASFRLWGSDKPEPPAAPPLTFSPANPLMNNYKMAGSSTMMSGKPNPLDVKISVQDGQIKDLIKVEIEDYDSNMINLLTQGGRP